jgi:hypothetical protein
MQQVLQRLMSSAFAPLVLACVKGRVLGRSARA